MTGLFCRYDYWPLSPYRNNSTYVYGNPGDEPRRRLLNVPVVVVYIKNPPFLMKWSGASQNNRGWKHVEFLLLWARSSVTGSARLSSVTGLNCLSSPDVFAPNPSRPFTRPPALLSDSVFFGPGYLSVMDGGNFCLAQGMGKVTANDGSATTMPIRYESIRCATKQCFETLLPSLFLFYM